MSYARFKAGESDVYVIAHENGHLVCYCAQAIDEDHEWFSCITPNDMLQHLREHQAKGDLVPEKAPQRLTEEAQAIWDLTQQMPD